MKLLDIPHVFISLALLTMLNATLGACIIHYISISIVLTSKVRDTNYNNIH